MDFWSETFEKPGDWLSHVTTGPWLPRGESHDQWLIRSASLVHDVTQLAHFDIKARGNVCKSEIKFQDKIHGSIFSGFLQTLVRISAGLLTILTEYIPGLLYRYRTFK
jgi:hypothetical protein